MFRPVSSKPDFVAQEHEILDQWRDRRTFARLRAQKLTRYVVFLEISSFLRLLLSFLLLFNFLFLVI